LGFFLIACSSLFKASTHLEAKHHGCQYNFGPSVFIQLTYVAPAPAYVYYPQPVYYEQPCSPPPLLTLTLAEHFVKLICLLSGSSRLEANKNSNSDNSSESIGYALTYPRISPFNSLIARM